MLDISEFFPHAAKMEGAVDVLSHLPMLSWDEFFRHQEDDIMGEVHKTCIIAENVQIGEGSVIDPFVVIEKNVDIGKNCLIRSGALIREGSVIGDNVVIGHGSEIKHAFIFDEAKIGSLAFVGDTIVGYGARIGSGVITGNRRFDQEEIYWTVGEQKISSSLDKVGAIIGDFARLGAGVITNPGAIIGSYSYISGGQVISGYIEPKMYIKTTGERVVNNQVKDLSPKDAHGNV